MTEVYGGPGKREGGGIARAHALSLQKVGPW